MPTADGGDTCQASARVAVGLSASNSTGSFVSAAVTVVTSEIASRPAASQQSTSTASCLDVARDRLIKAADELWLGEGDAYELTTLAGRLVISCSGERLSRRPQSAGLAQRYTKPEAGRALPL